MKFIFSMTLLGILLQLSNQSDDSIENWPSSDYKKNDKEKSPLKDETLVHKLNYKISHPFTQTYKIKRSSSAFNNTKHDTFMSSPSQIQSNKNIRNTQYNKTTASDIIIHEYAGPIKHQNVTSNVYQNGEQQDFAQSSTPDADYRSWHATRKKFGSSNTKSVTRKLLSTETDFISKNQNPNLSEKESELVSIEKRNDQKKYIRNFKYDPALIFMGLGKRGKQYSIATNEPNRLSKNDPTSKHLKLWKMSAGYDPGHEVKVLVKRSSEYDTGLNYMGLGKRRNNFDPALQYMGLGKRENSYVPFPRFKNTDFDKRHQTYDPALNFMGLGKKKSNYDPAFKYMGLGKRESNYDPALKFMGLGKRKENYNPSLQNMELREKKSSYDPALQYMGLGKRQSAYDPALNYMGLGKRKLDYDPALNYMGLGKRKLDYDPAFRYMDLDKKSDYDPTLRYIGLDKKSNYNPDLRYLGLDKKSDYDPALRYMGLGKRYFKYDPAMKYLGLGKRENSESEIKGPTEVKSMANPPEIFEEYIREGLEKLNNQIDKNISSSESYHLSPPSDINAKRANYDPALNYMGLGKKDFSYDPALKLMGLGKRESKVKSQKSDSDEKSDFNEHLSKKDNYNKELSHTSLRDIAQKRSASFDPALKFMGLSKRTTVSNHPSKATPGDKESVRHDLKYKFSGVKVFSNPIQKEQNVGNDDDNIHKFQPLLSSLLTPSMNMNCGIDCNPIDLHRHKRSLAATGSKMFGKFQSPFYEVVTENESPSLDRTKREFSLKSNVKKDFYHRPKYNPGWIFIGLGKRSHLKSSTDAHGTKYSAMKNPTLFNKYYDLLSSIQESIEKIQNDLKIKNKLSGSTSSIFEKPDAISDYDINWIPRGNYAFLDDNPNESYFTMSEENDVGWSQI